jgi:hypothetical protein
MDGADFVERYYWFGAMYEMVRPAAASLIRSKESQTTQRSLTPEARTGGRARSTSWAGGMLASTKPSRAADRGGSLARGNDCRSLGHGHGSLRSSHSATLYEITTPARRRCTASTCRRRIPASRSRARCPGIVDMDCISASAAMSTHYPPNLGSPGRTTIAFAGIQLPAFIIIGGCCGGPHPGPPPPPQP